MISDIKVKSLKETIKYDLVKSKVHKLNCSLEREILFVHDRKFDY